MIIGEEFRGRKVSVIGAARSGIAAARVLAHLGADVLLSDSKTVVQMGTAPFTEVEAAAVPFVPGASVEQALPEGVELVVTSPGVPRTAPVLQEAVRRSLPVWSEIELAYRLATSPLIGITGTNGKTTTTLLITAMLQEAGKNAIVAGNISADAIKRTLVEAACEVTGSEGVLVAEISSFQLEWVERFAPKVAILTNITPDHLNRHADFAEYAQTKARIFAAQKSDDWAIVNYDNPAAREIGMSGLTAQRCWFTRADSPPESGPAAWVQNGWLTVQLHAAETPVEILPVGELSPALPGAHSIENALAAAAAALAMGAEPEAIARAARTFPGVAHRMEFVADKMGVRYINNSMCTNVEAAVQSLLALDRPAVVIAGGADKALDFALLAPALRAKAKHLILIGTAADKMETTFRAGGYEAIHRADTLEDAVGKARSLAVPGEAVLLSPACASFDMFADFEARGAAFRNIVRALPESDS